MPQQSRKAKDARTRSAPTRIKATEKVVVPPMDTTPEKLAKALFRLKSAPSRTS